MYFDVRCGSIAAVTQPHPVLPAGACCVGLHACTHTWALLLQKAVHVCHTFLGGAVCHTFLGSACVSHFHGQPASAACQQASTIQGSFIIHISDYSLCTVACLCVKRPLLVLRISYLHVCITLCECQVAPLPDAGRRLSLPVLFFFFSSANEPNEPNPPDLQYKLC